MQSIVAGDGSMGRAMTAALVGIGEPPLAALGMPRAPSGHEPARFVGADVLFDFSVGEAVLPNLRAALDGGVKRAVIGTTNWSKDRAEVERLLVEGESAAVASPSFSIGVMLFARLVEAATRVFAPFAEFDPFVLEWHRRTKGDRPSGTALELARRIIAASPRKDRVAEPRRTGPPEPNELDVAVVRAGANPGMHLVGFDSAGETLELRLTARDRSAYAAGAIAAATWLLDEPRSPGLHTFDEVLDSILAAAGAPAAASPA